MAYYPYADRTIKGTSAGRFTGGPYKGVLHSTEGSSGAGAIGAFKNNNSWPHFLVDYTGKVWQFLDTAVAGRALRNLSGGVQTNTDSAIQIEIVGFAGSPYGHPQVQMSALGSLMRWIERTTGVKPVGPGRSFATAYGQKSLRFTNAQWDGFAGWCGHCHVPENDHWDPGAISIDALLNIAPSPAPAPGPTPAPTPGFNVPASYFTEVIVPFTVFRPQGGYIVVGGDGGVFTTDTPFYGSVPGLGVQAKIVSAAWTPTGAGYWLLGDDGGVFTFGDAAYRGGFNSLDATVKGNRKPIGIIAKGNGYRIVTLDPSSDGSPFDSYEFGV